MDRRIFLALPACALAAVSFVQITDAQTIVPYAQRFTVDSDADTVVDLFDNAPGTFNPSQIDSDNDLIGDDIDPTPFGSNPALGDPGLLLGAPQTIPAGSHDFIGYLMALQVPPGAFGHIDMDFGGDSTIDAVYFGPLTATVNQVDVPPGLYVNAVWDLNTPGTYTVKMTATGPGMVSQNPSITNVNVTPAPEPAAGATALIAIAGLFVRRRRRE
jgi:MYXO-CTERM domain-containing protein